MKTLCLFLSLLASGPAPTVAPAALFPEVAGWKPLGEVSSYGPDSLWQYIDGAAELFLAFGFRNLEVREMEAGEVRITVSIYDMGSRLSAFGVFATEAGAGDIRPGVGAGWALVAPEQCLLAKDRFYVKIDATLGRLSSDAAATLAQALAAGIPGADGPPPEIDSLPPGTAHPSTARYTMKGFLGLSEMPAVVHAPLAGGPENALVFVLVPGDGEKLETLWGKLAARWSAVERKGRPVLTREIPYRGTIGVIRAENRIMGLAGLGSPDELLKRLDSLLP